MSEVEWIKDGEVIAINSSVTNNGSRLTINYYDNSSSQLSIASASSQDSGTYSEFGTSAGATIGICWL